MRRPTARAFAWMYGAVWIGSCAAAFVASGYQPLAIVAVNVGFIAINIMAMPFAARGIVPWRDAP